MLMNDSIKRVQSQAGLSFAERENQRSAAGGKANLRPEVKQKDFMKSAGTRGYSPLARVMTLAVMMFTLATTGAWAQEQWDVVWDFTAWSTETVTALKADAAASKLEGWSDVEKQTDAEAGDDPTDATKDNCFWSCSSTVNADGNLSANGAVIKEFQGLKFNSDYAARRELAIAVNYPSTSLGTYHGPAYLHLGGKNQTCFTIPGVKAGSKITIEVESHKTSSARGIGLYKNSYAAENLIGEQFTPKTFEAKTWEIAEDCNVVVYNTNSCHIYTIKVKAPAAAAEPGKYTVAMAAEAGEGWTIEPAEATTTGVDKDTKITATYSGTKHVKSVTAVVKAAEEPVTLATPLTIEALTAGTIVVLSPKSGMQYSLNGGAKTAVSGNTANIPVTVGDKVAFYGDGTSITVYDGTRIGGSGDGFTCKVYGNIMSLVDEDGYETATTLSNHTYVFYELFSGNTALTDASQLLLPATELANSCYYSMFRYCVNLTAGPAELPATELTNSCYSYMFYGCSSLTAGPALPATELATSCYRYMFQNCSSLTAAPELPATTLVSNCYQKMFQDCSNLSSVTCLATSGINESASTTNWLYGAGSNVTGTKTVTAATSATWPEGNNGIPTGWTRVNKQ